MPAHAPAEMPETREGGDGQEAGRARKRARWDAAPDAAEANGANYAASQAQPQAAAPGGAAGTAAALDRARQMKPLANMGDIKAKLAALKACDATTMFLVKFANGAQWPDEHISNHSRPHRAACHNIASSCMLGLVCIAHISFEENFVLVSLDSSDLYRQWIRCE